MIVGNASSAATQIAHHTIPEPGQLVEARRRQWIVSEVDGGSTAPGLPKRHLIRLTSIDEDALGEEIEVLWELEPGAHVIERAGWECLKLCVSERAHAVSDTVRRRNAL
ncbi:hypothetical protein, partial [Paracoccus sp. (in: a-proteobacteria)]|uniref:hypothetical protein n=1 Tax=Paracoccus sp. TaxID=267 RepID=UPI00321FFBDF